VEAARTTHKWNKEIASASSSSSNPSAAAALSLCVHLIQMSLSESVLRRLPAKRADAAQFPINLNLQRRICIEI
jgi:hypothetical protein